MRVWERRGRSRRRRGKRRKKHSMGGKTAVKEGGCAE